MPHHSSPETNVFLVTVRRERVAELVVNAASAHEAREVARDRIGGGEALVWASVGEPEVVGAELVSEHAEAVA